MSTYVKERLVVLSARVEAAREDCERAQAAWLADTKNTALLQALQRANDTRFGVLQAYYELAAMLLRSEAA